MRKIILLALVISATWAQGADRFMNTDADIMRFVAAARAATPADLKDTPGEFSCGPFISIQQPKFRVRAKTFELAQVRAGLQCIRWQCNFDHREDVGRPTSIINAEDVEKVNRLKATGIPEQTAIAIVGQQAADRSMQATLSAPLDCDHGGNAAMIAYVRCFSGGTSCGD